MGDRRHCFGALQRLSAIAGNRIPETCAAHRETYEARHARSDGESTAYLRFIGAGATHDTADLSAPGTPCDLHHALAIGMTVQAFHIPHIGLDAGVFQSPQDLLYPQRARSSIKDVPLTTCTRELVVTWRYRQFEHEPALPAATCSVFSDGA